MPATVIYTAAGFDEQSAALPIVASLANEQGLYRAGQLVQVLVPVEEEQELLTIPAGSVSEHEGKTFVFVPEGEGKYRRRDVEIAWTQGPWAVVSSGLTVGTSVVSENAFYLKSELLLESEE